MQLSPAPTLTPPMPEDETVVLNVLNRVATDLSMITDRAFDVQSFEVARIEERERGLDEVHISFKLMVSQQGGRQFGCFLMPLPEAISLACYLMIVPDDSVVEQRLRRDLDASLKDALLEIGNFIASSVDEALREHCDGAVEVRSASCQGVRPGIRPAFPYEDGEALLLAKAQVSIHEFEPFELLLMLPEPI
jgi:chemotaxis protein CheY-P-specific phosphatase CheC